MSFHRRELMVITAQRNIIYYVLCGKKKLNIFNSFSVLLTENSSRFSDGIVSRTGLKTTSFRPLSFRAIEIWKATKLGLSARKKERKSINTHLMFTFAGLPLLLNPFKIRNFSKSYILLHLLKCSRKLWQLLHISPTSLSPYVFQSVYILKD